MGAHLAAADGASPRSASRETSRLSLGRRSDAQAAVPSRHSRRSHRYRRGLGEHAPAAPASRAGRTARHDGAWRGAVWRTGLRAGPGTQRLWTRAHEHAADALGGLPRGQARLRSRLDGRGRPHPSGAVVQRPLVHDLPREGWTRPAPRLSERDAHLPRVPAERARRAVGHIRFMARSSTFAMSTEPARKAASR